MSAISVNGNYASATHQDVLDLLNEQFDKGDLNIQTLDGEVVYDTDDLAEWITDFEDSVSDQHFTIISDEGSVSVRVNGDCTYTVQQVG